MDVWILHCYDDGVLGVFSSEELAVMTLQYNHENNFYHEEDQMITKERVISEVTDD